MLPPATERHRYLKGVALIVAATILLSLSGVFVRLMATNDPWLINGYRAGSMSITLVVFLLATYGRQTWSRFASIERPTMLSVSLFFAVGTTLYVVALSRTSIANVSCLTATAPVFAAILARLLIGERSGRMAWFATGIALFGIYVIFRDELGVGDPVGNVVALATAICFAGQAVLVRKYSSVDLVPAICVGGVLVAVGVPLLHGVPLGRCGRPAAARGDGRDPAGGADHPLCARRPVRAGHAHGPDRPAGRALQSAVGLDRRRRGADGQCDRRRRHHRHCCCPGRPRTPPGAVDLGDIGLSRVLGGQIALDGFGSRRRRW